MIAVIVLSQTVVLLSRERVNREALEVLEIAFKILGRFYIALRKPVLFIQTKTNADGELLDGNDDNTDGPPRTISKEELLTQIRKDMPFIDVPDLEVLQIIMRAQGMHEGMAERFFENATNLYRADVRNLLERGRWKILLPQRPGWATLLGC